MAEWDRQQPFSSRLSLRRGVTLALFGVGLSLTLALILTFHFLPSRYDLNVGDVSTLNVKSPINVTFVSEVLTREARERAVAAVANIYKYDESRAGDQRQAAADAIKQIEGIRDQTTAVEHKREQILKIAGLEELPLPVVDDILSLESAAWKAAAAEALRAVDQVMREKIAEDQVEQARNRVDLYVSGSLSAKQATVAVHLSRAFIVPNVLFDEQATSRAREEASSSVEPVQVTLKQGESILHDGDVVSPTDLEKLQFAGLRNPVLRWEDVLGVGMLVALLVSVLCAYLPFFQPAMVGNPRRMLLLAVIIIVAMLAGKLMIPGHEFYAYLFPIAAVSMLVAVLLDVQLGIVVTGMLALLFGMLNSNSLEFAVLAFVGGLVGALALWRVERFTSFFLSGLYVGAVSFIVAAGFYVSQVTPDPNRLMTLGFLSMVNGVLAATVTLSTVYLFGHIFGITTTLGLLELAHPSQPLFRRLLTEAPGTYHHSVVVANLVERAAQVVGADALLLRVGAYYHDIGKTLRPYAFIENQIEGQNIHDQLDARASAQLVAAHVRDGAELARRYQLPSKIRDLIEQHHGTRVVTYFYHQACKAADNCAVDRRAFSYPGPRPQTKEAAILMLADGVEAVVRADADHSYENIGKLVQMIISERVSEGQLDECDLTLRDLDQIKRAFVSVLQGIYHPRIQYPAEPAPMASRLPSSEGGATATQPGA